jgi:hypothetical protein
LVESGQSPKEVEDAGRRLGLAREVAHTRRIWGEFQEIGGTLVTDCRERFVYGQLPDLISSPVAPENHSSV